MNKMTFGQFLEELWRSFLDFSQAHQLLVTSILGTGFGYILIRQWMIGGPVRSHARMDGKTVLITGGNTGLGKATAEELMGRGARVVIACRDVQKGAAALREIHTATGQNRGSVKLLDLSSFESIHQFVDSFLKEEKKLDVLINNAGVFCPRLESKDGYELQFAVNHLGPFLLTNLLLDLLKKSAPSRIINVSSKAYEMGKVDFDDLNSKNSYDPLATYSNTKLYNILFTRELSRRLRGTGVMANCLHPGLVYTNVDRNLSSLEWNWFIRMLALTVGRSFYYLFANSPRQGSRTTVYCAVAPELENVSGKYFCDSHIAELAEHAMDPETAERLWDVSEELVKLSKKD